MWHMCCIKFFALLFSFEDHRGWVKFSWKPGKYLILELKRYKELHINPSAFAPIKAGRNQTFLLSIADTKFPESDSLIRGHFGLGLFD